MYSDTAVYAPRQPGITPSTAANNICFHVLFLSLLPQMPFENTLKYSIINIIDNTKRVIVADWRIMGRMSCMLCIINSYDSDLIKTNPKIIDVNFQ